MKCKFVVNLNGFVLEIMYGFVCFVELQEVQLGGLCSDFGMYYGLYLERGFLLILVQLLNILVVVVNVDERREQLIIECVMICYYLLYVFDCIGKIVLVVVVSQFQLGK